MLVKTGLLPDAAFDGGVFLKLDTSWESSGEIQLVNDASRFDAGTTQVSEAQRTGISSISCKAAARSCAHTLAVSLLSFLPPHIPQEFTLKVPISYCNSLSLRIDPARGRNTKRWNLDSVQLTFPESGCKYLAPYRDSWVELSNPTVTLTPAVGDISLILAGAVFIYSGIFRVAIHTFTSPSPLPP